MRSKWMRTQIEETAPDPLRAMLVEMVNQLMSAEVAFAGPYLWNDLDHRQIILVR